MGRGRANSQLPSFTTRILASKCYCLQSSLPWNRWRTMAETTKFHEISIWAKEGLVQQSYDWLSLRESVIHVKVHLASEENEDKTKILGRNKSWIKEVGTHSPPSSSDINANRQKAQQFSTVCFCELKTRNKTWRLNDLTHHGSLGEWPIKDRHKQMQMSSRYEPDLKICGQIQLVKIAPVPSMVISN